MNKKFFIKSKKDTYSNLIYDDRNLEEVIFYKYLAIDIHAQMVVKYGGATFLENLGGRLSKSRSSL